MLQIEFEVNPDTGVEMGDTLFHVAARACNIVALRCCVLEGFGLSRRNKNDMVSCAVGICG